MCEIALVLVGECTRSERLHLKEEREPTRGSRVPWDSCTARWFCISQVLNYEGMSAWQEHFVSEQVLVTPRRPGSKVWNERMHMLA
jgi:hypothetical protein